MGKVSLPRLQKQLAYREVSHHCLQARKPPNGKRISRAAKRSAGVTVGGAVARPTADSELDVRVSPHPAPRPVGPCQWYSPACAWS